ncbi:MAG: type III pantothenate kinase [Flavobacteriales bacterium]
MAIAPPDLVLDIGNSRTKAALFRDGSLLRHGVLDNHDRRVLETWITDVRPARVALASTGEEHPALTALVHELAPVTRITGESPSPLGMAYTTPHTLGTDRLANAVAAWRMFPQRASIAMDLGTCITYDVVDEGGTYRGGAISPGLRLRAEAMHERTARLPLVEVSSMPALLGTDTTGALLSGTYHGILAELLGYMGGCRQQWPNMAVVLTGGDAPLFVAALGTRIFADPLLTLRGLHALLEHQHTSGIDAAGIGR